MGTPEKKVRKRHRKTLPSNLQAHLYTFVGVQQTDEDPPPYIPPKVCPPITDFLFQWPLPPPVNKFNQTIHRYHRLWADTINELDHGFNMEEGYQASYVEGYFWSAMEKQRFFTALDKCGPHDPVAIQQRIGPTKTVYQVQLYINILQEASDEHPAPEDTRSTNNVPFAYEMSQPWIAFEEQQARLLTTILDNEAISLEQYHRSVDKVTTPDLAVAQRATDQELFTAQEIIDPYILYACAAKNPVDWMVPPTMTMETQTVLYRLLRKFVAEVMTCVILTKNRQRRRRYGRRQLRQQQNTPLRLSKDNDDDPTTISEDDDEPTPKPKSEPVDDMCDIGESDIKSVLRDYYDHNDSDTDMDETIKQELVHLDDEEDSGSDGFVVGANSDFDSDSNSDSNTDSDSDSNSCSDSEGDDNLDGIVQGDSEDGSMYEASSVDNDSDDDNSKCRGEAKAKAAKDDSDAMEQGSDDDMWMQQQDRAYEQGLYQSIIY